MEMICNRLPLAEVMAKLAHVRRVFHSEADFQFAFAQMVRALDPTIEIRLEVPARNMQTKRTEYIDIVCIANSATRIELKYPTRKWEGVDEVTGEEFLLRNHAAMDLARHAFIHDVYRLERLTTDQGSNGLAILLTNNPNLWEPATRTSRDAAFRIHEGSTISGQLTWGTPASPYPRNDRTIRGRYDARWNDYSQVEGGQLRWLGWSVAALARQAE